VRNDVAVTGVVGAEVALTRTTSVGTGGVVVNQDTTVLTAPSLSRFNPNDEPLPSSVTARVAPTGGAGAGALLGTRYLFTEETNAGTALGGIQGAEYVRNNGADVRVPMGTGLRFVQGTVASVGTLAFEMTFELM
jgi:hypothetical protein